MLMNRDLMNRSLCKAGCHWLSLATQAARPPASRARAGHHRLGPGRSPGARAWEVASVAPVGPYLDSSFKFARRPAARAPTDS